MAMTPEKKFQMQVKRDLERLEDIYFFVKEAAALRGIPDLIGCLNGMFFALELKKDLSSTRRKTGRIVLQKLTLDKINKAGGFGRLTCPETWEQDLSDLISFTNVKRTI